MRPAGQIYAARFCFHAARPTVVVLETLILDILKHFVQVIKDVFLLFTFLIGPKFDKSKVSAKDSSNIISLTLCSKTSSEQCRCSFHNGS